MTMLWITVDRVQKTPIVRQVYDQVRLSIVRGDLRAGEQLPSTRELARTLPSDFPPLNTLDIYPNNLPI